MLSFAFSDLWRFTFLYTLIVGSVIEAYFTSAKVMFSPLPVCLLEALLKIQIKS